MANEERIKRLKSENRALKETCEILSDKKVMSDIKKSLDEIKSGKFVTISNL